MDDDSAPEVNYDIAMEILKNSSIQMLFKVDRFYSEQQTELVLQKIKREVSNSIKAGNTDESGNKKSQEV